MTNPPGEAAGAGLIEALHVSGPAPEHRDKLMLFGRFVGSWAIRWSGASSQQATGELHFGWVLGGRAIQDTWIVPGRGQPGAGEPPLAFHGTTVRFYDPVIGAWRSTWIEPVNNRVRRFIGRPEAADIVLLSTEEEPQLRWRFTDIGPDSLPGSASPPATAAPPGTSMRRCTPPGSGAPPAAEARRRHEAGS